MWVPLTKRAAGALGLREAGTAEISDECDIGSATGRPSIPRGRRSS